MAKTKTEELREKIHNLGVEISSLAAREYVGEAEDYIAEFDRLIGQILEACKDAGLAFVVKDAKVPQRQKCRTIGVVSLVDALGKADAYLQGQIDAQEAMIGEHWQKTKEIELT